MLTFPKRACLLATFALPLALTTSAAHSQAGSPSGLGVAIINTPSNPVPVTVTNPISAGAETPISHVAVAEFMSNGFSQDITITPQVANGQRFVVKYINVALTINGLLTQSATCSTRLNQTSRATTGPSVSVPATGSLTSTGNQMVNLVLTAGESVTMRCAAPTGGFTPLRVQAETIVSGSVQ